MTMSDPRDRLIAERMGKTWERCPDGCMFFVEKGAGHEGLHYDNIPFDLSQPHHREAVIAWLNAQGFKVTIEYLADGYRHIDIRESENVVACRTLPTIEEAFRAAVLAATEGKEQ